MLPAEDISQGPYRATKLWNEAVRLFKSGMPTKRHWNQFKMTPDTFTATEAADWMHDLLKSNLNFGSQVTRPQTLQLLGKFLKNHVIEDVFGRWGTEHFNDNGQLYRFPIVASPSKAIRQPLAFLNSNLTSPRQRNIQIAKRKFMMQSKLKNAGLSKEMIADIWKNAIISRLQRVLHLPNIDDLLQSKTINADWLQLNATKDELSSVTEHGMPYWVISAMQCLATWPNSESSGLPNYPGFERDVFAAICGYFQATAEPLLTFELYQTFINVLTRSEMLDEVCQGNEHKNMQGQYDMKPNHSIDQVEKLRRQLLQAQMRHQNKAIRRHRSVRLGSGRAKCLNFNQDIDGYSSLQRPRNTYHSSMQNLSQIGWKLDDTASRSTWAERFSSVQALDDLSEEGSSQVGFRRNQPGYGSRDDVSDDFQLGNGCDEEYGFIKLENDGKTSSVENLLLNMSQQMQCEMEEALMEDNSDEAERIQSSVNEEDARKMSEVKLNSSSQIHAQRQENVYSTIKNQAFVSSKHEDVVSPMYRTMKPCSFGNASHIASESHRRQNAHSVPYSMHAEKRENPYMEMFPKHSSSVLATDSNNANHEKYFESQDTVLDYLESKGDISFLKKESVNMTGREKTRRSLKATKEQLEEKLMGIGYETPVINYAKQSKDMLRRKSNSRLNTGKLESEFHQLNVSAKSDIIARFEVPPIQVEKRKNFNYHTIQSRLVRLPYVSQGMVPSSGTIDESVKENKSGSTSRLSRSYSSLSHRRPVKAFPRTGHHVSMHALHHPSDAQRRIPENRQMSLQRETIAKSCHNIVQKQSDIPAEPQSPLTAAFDSARQRTHTKDSSKSSHVVESLQLCFLLIPPANRSKLRLLIRLMLKICENPHLVDLHDELSTRTLVIRKFTPCVISQQPGKNATSSNLDERLVGMLLDKASLVMESPANLKKMVEDSMNDMKKPVSSNDLVANNDTKEKKKTLRRQKTFCKQLSVDEYEQQRKSNLQMSLKQLLNDILSDQNMTAKEKKKKLKQFQKSYPEIYEDCNAAKELVGTNTTSRRKPMFSSALRRLRSIRS